VRRDAGFFGKPHQIHDRMHAELLHHPPTADLDGLFRRSQIGNLFVEPTGYNVRSVPEPKPLRALAVTFSKILVYSIAKPAAVAVVRVAD
jgi:hypothetical protein